MASRLRPEEVVTIQVLSKKRVSARAIARQLGVTEGSVRYHLRVSLHLKIVKVVQARRRSDGEAKKPGSANALRSSLKGFFGYLHRAGYIATDPARLIRRARAGATPPRGLTAEQRDRLLQALVAGKDDEAQRDRLLFSLMLGTGIRLGSAIELDVRDLDLEEGRIVLRRTKGGGADSLFVNRSLAAELRAFLGNRTSGPLFLAAGERRTSARQVQRRFSQWIEKAGTRMARNGVPLAVAQRMLGHGTVALTAQVYTQLETEDLREAVESLPALRVARDG